MAQWHSRRDFLKRSIVWTIGTTWVGAAIDALAQAPQLLNYQGRLTDANGAPRNGSFPMSFAILGGTSSWSEAQTVNVANGFFSVLLGSVTSEVMAASHLPVLAVKHYGRQMSMRDVLLSSQFWGRGDVKTS
mgnify:CR=1 FL=1